VLLLLVAAAVAAFAFAFSAAPTDDEADYALHALDLSPVCSLDNVARSKQKPTGCLWFFGACFCFIK